VSPVPAFRRPVSGFTLLEIMVVLLILSFLVTFLITGGMDIFRTADRAETENRIHQLASMIETWRTREGQYPDDRLPPGLAGNTVNASSEALFLAFFDPGYRGQRPDPDWLVNTDRDETIKNHTILDSRELFEIGDAWGNPIAYFESLHYTDGVQSLRAGVDGEEGGDLWEQEVRARQDQRTGAWENEGGFQLISAGPDGAFGTEDDIANFGR